MVKSNDGAVELSGRIDQVLFEAAHIMHAVSTAAAKEIPGVDYNQVIKKILDDLAIIASADKNNGPGTGKNDKGFDQKEIQFLREASELQNKNKDNPNFIFVDEMRRDPYVKTSASTKGSTKKNFTVKDFIMDPRFNEKDHQ